MDMVKIGNREITTHSLDNLVKLADAMDDVKIRDNGDLYIKFKKDLIVENNGNFALISDGFNVQVANQVHFNPEFERETFKKMIIDSFTDTRYKIVEKAAELLERELTPEEIMAVVNGKALAELAEYDRSIVMKRHKESTKNHIHTETCNHDYT
jgi:hypothetical protein